MIERRQKKNLSFSESFQNKLIRSKSLFLNYKYRNKKYLIWLLSIFCLITVVIFVRNYKQNKFEVNDLKFINKEKVNSEIKDVLETKSYLRLNLSYLINYLKEKNSLIKEVYVNKTLYQGLKIEIEEYVPTLEIKTNDKKNYIFTEDKEFIAFENTQTPLMVLNFDGTSEDFPFVKSYIEKATIFIKEINKSGILGRYNFDKFGNLFILTLDGNKISVDLNERYSSIDEQLKVFQNALRITSFSEIDLRFNYLVIKE